MSRRPLRPRLSRKSLMMVIALSAGVAAAWLSQQQIQTRIAQLENEARVPMTAVVVASRHLPAGVPLDADGLAVRDFPTEWVSPSALLPEHAAELTDMQLAHAVDAGEPILRAHLAPMGPPGFAARLGDGRRAVTIPVDEISSVSGLLQPGDRIDLYVSFTHEGHPVTVPLLQQMRVLATGRQVDAGAAPDGAERSFSTVTLDASLDEAVKLVAARQEGTLTAMLRRPGDLQAAHAESRGSLAKVLGLTRPRPTADLPRRRVPVIYGDRPLRAIPRLDRPEAAEGADADDESGDAGQDDSVAGAGTPLRADQGDSRATARPAPAAPSGEALATLPSAVRPATRLGVTR